MRDREGEKENSPEHRLGQDLQFKPLSKLSPVQQRGVDDVRVDQLQRGHKRNLVKASTFSGQKKRIFVEELLQNETSISSKMRAGMKGNELN